MNAQPRHARMAVSVKIPREALIVIVMVLALADLFVTVVST